jgi:C4-type Zn-finger protein
VITVHGECPWCRKDVVFTELRAYVSEPLIPISGTCPNCQYHIQFERMYLDKFEPQGTAEAENPTAIITIKPKEGDGGKEVR